MVARQGILLSLMAVAPLVVGGQGAFAERMTVVPSEDAQRQVHVLTRGIKWHTSLEEAEAAAKRDGRLIFWVHMLGDIDGKT